MRTIISEERLRAMLEKMLLKEDKSYIVKRLYGNTYSLTGLPAQQLLDLLKDRLPAYGQYFETAARMIIKDDKDIESKDLNPDASGGTAANSPFFDFIESASGNCTLETNNTNLSVITIKEPMVTVKSTYSALDFSGENKVIKVPKILDFILTDTDEALPCSILKIKAGSVYVRLNAKQSLEKKKLVYTIIYNVPKQPNIALIKDQELIDELSSIGDKYKIPTHKLFTAVVPAAFDSGNRQTYDVISDRSGFDKLFTLMSYASNYCRNPTAGPLTLNETLRKSPSGSSKAGSFQSDIFKNNILGTLKNLKTVDLPAFATVSERIDASVINAFKKGFKGASDDVKIEKAVEAVNVLIKAQVVEFLKSIKEMWNPTNSTDTYSITRDGSLAAMTSVAKATNRITGINQYLKDEISKEHFSGAELFDLEVFKATATIVNGKSPKITGNYFQAMYDAITADNIENIASCVIAMVKANLSDSAISELKSVKIHRGDVDANLLTSVGEAISGLETDRLIADQKKAMDRVLGANSNTGTSLGDFKITDDQEEDLPFKIYALDASGVPRRDITKSSPSNHNAFYKTLFLAGVELTQQVYDLEINVRPSAGTLDTEIEAPLRAELEALNSVLAGTIQRIPDIETREQLSAEPLLADEIDEIENIDASDAQSGLTDVQGLLQGVIGDISSDKENLSPEQLEDLRKIEEKESELAVLYTLALREPLERKIELGRLVLRKAFDLLGELENLNIPSPGEQLTLSFEDGDDTLEEGLISEELFSRAFQTMFEKGTNFVIDEIKRGLDEAVLDGRLDKILHFINGIIDVLKSFLNVNENKTTTADAKLYDNIIRDIMEAAIKKRKSVKRK